jgi:hypothetical protein
MTPPLPGGVETSIPPMPAAVIFACRPLRIVALFTGDGPAGAAGFR